MHFETLKKDNKKYLIIGLIILIAIIATIVLATSLGAYRSTQSIELANGTVNYSLVDFEVVEIKIDNNPSETMPTRNYKLLDTSYCTTKDEQNQDKTDNNINLTYENGILNVTPYAKKGTKCHLYFYKPNGENTLASLNLTKNGTLGESVTGPSCEESSANCGGNGINMQQNGLYETEDDDGKSYIFRGTVTNNWVKFGKIKNGSKDIWWRIIRINGDGTIRLIYAGEGTSPTGNGANALNSIAYHPTYNDNTYVGYYYGTTGGKDFSKTHSNTTASNIATQTNTWFSNTTNLNETTQLNHIDENAGFCNNRQISSTKGEWWTSEGETDRGTGTVVTAYKGWYNTLTTTGSWRSDVNYANLRCSSEKENFEENTDYKRDYYTWKNHAKRGNKALDYPVGQITVDEVILAGGFGGQANSGYWLNSGTYYWTMSPYHFNGSSARVFDVANNGYLNNRTVGGTGRGVRPVINLKADTKFTFTSSDQPKGTRTNPYIVTE